MFRGDKFEPMNRRTRNEVLWLARESWMGRLAPCDPRWSATQRFWSMITRSGNLMAISLIFGPLTLSFLAAPFTGLVGTGALMQLLVTALTFGIVLFALFQALLALRRRRHLLRSDRMKCLWCMHPLTEGVGRGRCPECGVAYDSEVNRRILDLTLEPQRPLAEVYIPRIARLWTRAVILRDRSLADMGKPGGAPSDRARGVEAAES